MAATNTNVSNVDNHIVQFLATKLINRNVLKPYPKNHLFLNLCIRRAVRCMSR